MSSGGEIRVTKPAEVLEYFSIIFLAVLISFAPLTREFLFHYLNLSISSSRIFISIKHLLKFVTKFAQRVQFALDSINFYRTMIVIFKGKVAERSIK